MNRVQPIRPAAVARSQPVYLRKRYRRFMVPCRVLAWILGLTCGATSAQDSAPLLLVDQPWQSARLVDIRDGQVSFQTSSSAHRQLPWDQVVVWGGWKESAQGSAVILRDGSILVGVPSGIHAREIVISSELFGRLTLPREVIAGILIRPPTDLLERDGLLRRILVARNAQDKLWMFNGDELEGAVVSEGEGDPVAELRIGAANTIVPSVNVVALACGYSAPRTLTQDAPSMWLGLEDGTRLAVRKCVPKQGQLVLELQSGAALPASAEELWPKVNWVQPSATKFSYVSDQPVAGFKHIPLLAIRWELGLDRNTLGGQLRSSGRVCSKGLGMHSASRATINLARRFRWFESDLALDDTAGENGSVVFRVFTDRSAPGTASQWQLAYESPVVRGGAAPVPIRVDVSEAERLALVVDFAERGDVCDYANWLLARLIPRSPL